VARTLVTCHAAGVVHRDLKPSNILIDQEGRPRLLDFGVARDARSSSRLSATGELLGSPSYMAPEQVLGAAIDARTDVYGLGGVLYHGLTGKAPFDGRTLVEVLAAVVDRPPIAPSAVAPRGSRPSSRRCACAAWRRSRRAATPDALELAQDLERLGRGGRTVASTSRERERRGRVLRWSALALLLAVGLVAATLHLIAGRGARERDALRDARLADEALLLWSLGLGAGPAPEPAALADLAGRLRDAAPRLAGDGAELEALAGRLEGLARRTGPVEPLRTAADGLRGPDPDAALQLLARDAAAALPPAQARRLLELAWTRRLRRDDAPPADPVQLARELGAHLALRPDVPRELAEAAPWLVERAAEVALRRAIADGRAVEVAAVASLAKLLGPGGDAALSAGRDRVLDAAEARRLADRLVEGDPAGVVERLRLALAASGCADGETRRRFLDEVRAALAAQASGLEGVVLPMTEPRLVRAVRADGHLARLSPGPTRDPLRPLLEEAVTRSPRGAAIPLPVLEALVRYDVRAAEDRALAQLEALTDDQRQAMAAERPWSAVPGYARLLTLARRGDRAAPERLEAAEALVEGGMLDLHRVHRARVWFELATASLSLGDEKKARADRAREACEEAWAVLTVEDRRPRYRFVSAIVQRAFDARRKRLPDVLLAEELELLLRRLAGAQLGERQPDAEARFLGHVGDRVWDEPQLPLTLAWLERRVVERLDQLGGDPGDVRRCRAALAGARYSLGRFDEAEAAILPALPEGLDDDDLAEIAVRIAMARHDDDEARHRLELGLGHSPKDNDLLDLARKLR
jgi:hypothetical protein